VSIYQATFSTGDVCRVAGVTNPALQTWIRRGLIVGEAGGVDMPGKPGVRRSFGFYTVMEIAVAAALTDLGLSAAQAFKAAQRFAHTGDESRMAAFPFPDGRTFLCVAGDRSAELMWKPGEDLVVMARHHLGRPLGFTVLDVSALFDNVTAGLGYHPQKLLDDEYRKDGARAASWGAPQ